ncbi:MAG: cation-transporting P-type ATPase [Nanoarchaeota archaeon]|nr:cation-transporting P-type ATPase [Nanoarchaeota archaeon]MBU1988698.1 cation-transporting P-type ATPase [Nanoarchaeota archaeon]
MEPKERGLSSDEAKKRLEKYGLNEIKDIGKISPLKILLRQIKSNFLIYFLLFAMILSFFIGKSVTGYVILAVIGMVVVVGFIQEYRAEKAMEALKKMIMPISIVLRNGVEKEIPSKEIVPGDIVLLRNGEGVPADCIILEEKELLVNEAVLTGESKEVKKIVAKTKDNLKDENLLFKGSFIISGKCTAKVLHTGMNTKFGKIARMISTAEKELPLQKKVNTITKYMAIIAVTMALLTGLLIFFKTPLIDSEAIIGILILVIAISVSAFPEGLPVVLITTLSAGAYRMAKKNAIVNRMSIIETLGETTVICTDKTGTITKGEMTAKKIFTDNKFFDISGTGYEGMGDFISNKKKINLEKEKNLNLLLKTALMCNDSTIHRTGEDNIYEIVGSPTEAALLIMSAKAKLFKENYKTVREEELPFSSERKIMSVLSREGKKRIVYTKGALEVILKKCKFIQRENGIFRLLEKDKKRILKANNEMTSRLLRTIALAYKPDSNKTYLEKDLVFVGVVGMEDPPREEVKEALAMCKKAGIKVKMITGDNRETAFSIAREINLDKGEALDGEELDKINDRDLAKIVRNVVVFARVRPEHKLRIVKALKANGEIVTMTGDGVNDAPALKESHIGVAMGKNGTDVSRSVADLTLKDDNFATMVDAIKEGRTVFRNIRKFTSYQISCNYAELFIIFVGVLVASLFGWPFPLLLALQILFLNLVTDNLPAITLGLNPSSKDIMSEKPRKREILNKASIKLIILTGMIMGLITLAIFYTSFNVFGLDAVESRTTALLGLISLQISGAFIFRSFRKGVLNRSPFVNKYLFYASAVSIIATILVIYTPLNKIFETSSIGISAWAIAISASLFFILIFDILKRINNKKHFWKAD